MSDIVLISSSEQKLFQLSVYPYLGLGYLASELIKAGYSVKIYDIDAEKLSLQKIKKRLLVDRPMFIGINVMSRSLPFLNKLVNLIKENYREIKIIIGGPHVTSDPNIVMQLGVDFGLRGDSDFEFVKLINALKNNKDFSGIKGLVYFEKETRIDDINVEENLEIILEDSFKLYNFNLYADILFPGVKSFSLDTTRGCPFNCSFCSNASKTKVRFYSLNSIIQNIEILVNIYGIKWIAFVDDLFTINRQRVINLCNMIIEKKLKFRWSCLTRVDKIDEELIIIMKKAGLYSIIFGVESGNEKIRELDNKRITNNQYSYIIELCRKHNVKTLNTYIIGHPEESYKQMFQTIFYSLKLNSDLAHYQLMSPLPGSPIFIRAVKEGIFDEGAWYKYLRGETSEPFYFPSNRKLYVVKLIHILAYMFYYLRPLKFINISVRVIKIIFYKIKSQIYV